VSSPSPWTLESIRTRIRDYTREHGSSPRCLWVRRPDVPKLEALIASLCPYHSSVYHAPWSVYGLQVHESELPEREPDYDSATDLVLGETRQLGELLRELYGETERPWRTEPRPFWNRLHDAIYGESPLRNLLRPAGEPGFRFAPGEITVSGTDAPQTPRVFGPTYARPLRVWMHDQVETPAIEWPGLEQLVDRIMAGERLHFFVRAGGGGGPGDGSHEIAMRSQQLGSREWARITGANVGKRIAIAMDNSVFSAPVVEQKIIGGRSRITGLDSPGEARLLEIVLRAGALPAPVAIIEQRTVGASLGEDSIRSGLTATTIAFLFTVIFMVVYYNSAGTVADIALLFNMLFVLGILAGFQATLTLPGIAGIILTIGMAVDANVLINERVREELTGGKTLRAAIDAGYDKAFSAILDSNITTFLTGIILYQFGSGPVQGFALTLMIGIAATMFSALLITRVIFNLLTERSINPKFG